MPTLHSGNPKGFTLIEVLLVLVISALLLGAVATALSQGPVLRSTSRDIASSLKLARTQAILKQHTQLWSMDIEARQFGLYNETDTLKTYPDTLTAKLNTARSEVINTNAGGIRFFPDGSSTGGSIELTQNNQTYKINIEWVTGRVSIQ